MKDLPERRQVLKTGAGGLLLLNPRTVFGSQANSAIEIGVIGCGSRGKFISDLFIEHTGARVAAIADAFDEPLTAFRERYKVDATRAYRGLNGFRELCAARLDAVVIESPPYFHPDHAAAAVDNNKHVFLAKPVATDVPGCKSILASGERATGRVSFLVDFQTRAQPAFQEAASRMHNGEIGEPVFGHVYYHAGRTPYHNTEGMAREQATLRNWLHDKRLSGDIIVEQNIHVIDVANWYLKGRPMRAFGTGGQLARKLGDVWDHYAVTYWYANEVKVDFSSVQFSRGYSDLCIRIYGSEGTLDSHYNGLVRVIGKVKWTGVEQDRTFQEGAVRNIKAFVESIRTGKLLNNTAQSVESNLTAVLGRMAAARQQVVSWDEVMRTAERYDGKNKV